MSLLCSWDRMMGGLCYVFGKLHSAVCNQVPVSCLLKRVPCLHSQECCSCQQQLLSWNCSCPGNYVL